MSWWSGLRYKSSWSWNPVFSISRKNTHALVLLQIKCFFHVRNTIVIAKMLFVYESNTMPSIFFLPPRQKQIRSNYRAVKSQVYFELSRNRDSTMKGFEPSSHFKSRLSLIVRMNVVLNRTAAVDSEWRLDNLCGSHLQIQSELYHVSWWYCTLVIDLVGQLRRDVIGRL